MTDEELAEIEARWAKAEPGPWRAAKARTLIHVAGSGPVCSISVTTNHIHEDYPGCKAGYAARFEANAIAIGSAPQDVAALIAEVRRLKAENERLRNETHRLQPPMMDGGGYDLRNMPL